MYICKKSNNMKIGVIGDIHGRSIWKEFIKDETIDKWVFIGDYFDSFDISFTEQFHNFKELIKFKVDNNDKVVLLVGNHDYHYMKTIDETYSGYQYKTAYYIQALVTDAVDAGHLKLCYKHENFLFTHAGVTKTWYQSFIDGNEINIDMVETNLNDYFHYKPKVFIFNAGKNNSGYGDDITQGPLWVRPASLKEDMISGITHVVGHTGVDGITIYDNLILIDCLDYKNEYLVIENGKAEVKRI